MKEILYEKALQRLMEKELDPERSTILAHWESAEHTGSLRNERETLYVNGKGEYFIVYEGGMEAGFHELPGVGSWFGGSYIRPVSENDAFDWCEETGNYEAILNHLPFSMIAALKKKV